MVEDPAERRAYPRIEAEIEAQGAPDQGGVVARMVTRNLSLGGLFCTSARPFPEMTRLAVRLMLPCVRGENGRTEPVDLEAVVVRSEAVADASCGDARYELGLFFVNLDDGTRERLRRYLA